MKNAFIIHGSFGSPDGNWFRWLERELKQIEYDVAVSEFPIEDYDSFKKQVETDPHTQPQNQNLKNWIDVFQPFLKQISTDTIFVGHSLGPAFILRILERVSVRVKACIFAAGFVDMLPGFPAYNAVNRSFIEPEFDIEKIKSNCETFVCLGGDDDPYVPKESLEKFAKMLGVQLELVKDGGHLSEGSGMTTFPRILDIIQSLD